MVLVTRADKRKVYLHLLQEGVIVLKKDYTLEKHKDTGVPHLYVWMLLRSLKDRDLVELVFNWQYFYYYIKTDGVDFLRKQVGIQDDKIVPVTFKQNKKNLLMQNEEDDDVKRPNRGGFGGRGGQRFGGRGGGRGGFGGFRRGGDDQEGGADRPPREEGGAPEGGEGGRGGRFGGFRRRDEGGAPEGGEGGRGGRFGGSSGGFRRREEGGASEGGEGGRGGRFTGIRRSEQGGAPPANQ